MAHASPQPQQQNFLTGLALRSKVWKRVRSTSREVHNRQREEEKQKRAAGKETKQARAHRCLASFWNHKNYSPTALELFVYMKETGESVFDINDVRPKIFYLVKQGLVEPRAKRLCSVSGEEVWTWAIREKGSKEPR